MVQGTNTDPQVHDLRRLFTYYKELGEKALAQVTDTDLDRVPHPDGNSIAILVKHIAGNLRSRFTDFLTSDGEKPWRQRDAEFEGTYASREDLRKDWDSGWGVLFDTLAGLHDADLERVVYIRNEGHTAREALQRQVAHHAYHVGQIVLLARMCVGKEWRSLSIPRGGSQAFNQGKFDQEKGKRHFTEGK
ncbi:MAG: DUF1572 family protein [Flavobacteriales bacterium]|nr:DUF1572 family protein [Flavobacteriales bacterium]MCB9166918.1 DUF1572 family protein [Flavobacteriales bacterium]